MRLNVRVQEQVPARPHRCGDSVGWAQARPSRRAHHIAANEVGRHAPAFARRATPASLPTLYARLIAKGKAHNAVLIACTRKLLIYANTVVQRGTPWIESAA